MVQILEPFEVWDSNTTSIDVQILFTMYITYTCWLPSLTLLLVHTLQYDIYAIIRQIPKLKTSEDLQRSINIIHKNQWEYSSTSDKSTNRSDIHHRPTLLCRFCDSSVPRLAYLLGPYSISALFSITFQDQKNSLILQKWWWTHNSQ